jgi:chromosomal replication initiation ATPase DnaA
MMALSHFQHHGLWSPPSVRVADAPRETMRDIIERVAKKHRVTYLDLIGPTRKAPYPAIRFEAMWLCSEVKHFDGKPRWGLSQIGRAFNRDHTTVLHGVRAHKRRLGL